MDNKSIKNKNKNKNKQQGKKHLFSMEVFNKFIVKVGNVNNDDADAVDAVGKTQLKVLKIPLIDINDT